MGYSTAAGSDTGADSSVTEGGVTVAASQTIYAGPAHTCVIKAGKVKCWGYNSSGQLGIGEKSFLASKGDEPGEMGAALQAVDLGPATAKALALGAEHTCALLESGDVKCWGLNDEGQLGQGDILSRGDEPGELGTMLAPINLGAGRKATSIAAGASHSCALLDDGSVKCWGDNSNGQLGQGDGVARGINAGDMAALPSRCRRGKRLSASRSGVGRRASFSMMRACAVSTSTCRASSGSTTPPRAVGWRASSAPEWPRPLWGRAR